MTATTIAWFGPSSSNAIKAAAYDTDSVDPLVSARGSVTFQSDVRHENAIKLASIHGRGQGVGKTLASSTMPARVTAATYIWAPEGRAFQPVRSRGDCVRRQGRAALANIGFRRAYEIQLLIA